MEQETMSKAECPLCMSAGGELILQTPQWRLIRAIDQQGFPCTYRLIWQQHVAELSDLTREELQVCMDTLVWIERAMRYFLKPDKINLAELGNMVPHLHWHLIARYQWDSHFPNPIWGERLREVSLPQWRVLETAQQEMEAELIKDVKTLQQNF